MKIVEIINENHIFGSGQISHNPREYFLDLKGHIYNWIPGEPDAIIRCDGYNVNIKIASGFCMQIITADGWKTTYPKRLINTASPECCAKAAEEHLKTIACLSKYKTSRLRAYRVAAGLTRAQLGELCGMHPQSIAKYELGERDLRTASYESVMKLANALQCEPENIT